MASAETENTRVLASFETPDSTQNWVSVNDNVMGGISEGGFQRKESGTLLFEGDLSLENNGGFASIRTKPRTVDLSGMSGIAVRVRGDGRTYWVDLRVAGLSSVGSYRADLTTTRDEWTITRIPLENFKPQVFGRTLPGPPIDPSKINSVGFTIADKKSGPFQLEVEYVKAVFPDSSAKTADAPDTLQTLAPAGLIRLAIARGVPIFNAGNPGACAAVYEVACEALRVMPGVGEESVAILGQALSDIRTDKTDREKAWILRYALDQVLARLNS
jgi:hypothetical protein